MRRDHKQIYVGCAEADIRYREMLVNFKQRWELYTLPTIEFLTLDRKDAEMFQWKQTVNDVISKSDDVLILVSPQRATDSFALWEIDCAVSKNVQLSVWKSANIQNLKYQKNLLEK